MRDEWLRLPAAHGAILAERRFSIDGALARPGAYEKALDSYDVTRRIWYDMRVFAQSAHQQLLVEATMMELKLNALRAWARMAQRRLRAEVDRRGPKWSRAVGAGSCAYRIRRDRAKMTGRCETVRAGRPLWPQAARVVISYLLSWSEG